MNSAPRGIALRGGPRPLTGDPGALGEATRAERQRWPVALVSMPFYDPRWPAIQIGLLKVIAESHGFPAETLHLNLELAAAMGPELYHDLSEHDRGRSTGDWLFSRAAFGAAAPDPTGEFLRDLGDRLQFDDAQRSELERWRGSGVDRYLDRLVEEVAWDDYRVVGFTSTFAQTVPSLALAARLKRQRSELVVVFGGANCEGPMGVELARTMECIDYVVTGEGDAVFTELLVALSEERDPAGLPGIACRRDGDVVDGGPAAPVERLDDLPTPDYREYFRRASEFGIVPEHLRHQTWLPAQSARGCWWGERRHCTFCGLNGSTMAYRSKSPARLRQELAELSAQCGSVRFYFVDNILDRGYIDEFLPSLRADGVDYRFFYEVKSNLTRAQVARLADGGVVRIQPGIESLSSHVLGLMRKGVRAADNVNLLRWARHYGVDVNWNIIYGFPHETREDYDEQAELVPSLVHLQPPRASGRIWLERFSPIFTDRAAFPVRFLGAESAMPYIFPAGVDLDRLAYFFEGELADTLPDEAFEELRKLLERWREANDGGAAPSLTVARADGFIQIVDGRSPGTVGVHTFEGPLASLYLGLMDAPLTAARAAEHAGLGRSLGEVTEALDEFVARGLMMRDRNLFLSLALPPDHSPDRQP